MRTSAVKLSGVAFKTNNNIACGVHPFVKPLNGESNFYGVLANVTRRMNLIISEVCSHTRKVVDAGDTLCPRNIEPRNSMEVIFYQMTCGASVFGCCTKRRECCGPWCSSRKSRMRIRHIERQHEQKNCCFPTSSTSTQHKWPTL